MQCEQYIKESPENSKFPWCEKYQVNLDVNGRFCHKCRADAKFKNMLQEQFRVRNAQDCKGGGGYCEIYKIATDEKQCKKCNSEAEFKAFLRGQGIVARNERIENCNRRGQSLGYEERKCCGGKIKQLEIFECEIKGKVHRGECAICSHIIYT